MNTIPIVKAINVTTFRNHLKEQLDKVSTDHITLIVTRTDDSNVVVLSEKEYGDLVKRLNNMKYHLKLLKSAKEAENGNFMEISLDELETYE